VSSYPTQANGKHRGQGEDSNYRDSPKNQHADTISLTIPIRPAAHQGLGPRQAAGVVPGSRHGWPRLAPRHPDGPAGREGLRGGRVQLRSSRRNVTSSGSSRSAAATGIATRAPTMPGSTPARKDRHDRRHGRHLDRAAHDPRHWQAVLRQPAADVEGERGDHHGRGDIQRLELTGELPGVVDEGMQQHGGRAGGRAGCDVDVAIAEVAVGQLAEDPLSPDAPEGVRDRNAVAADRV